MSLWQLNARRRRRLGLVLLVLLGVGTAVALSLAALRENINLFYSPSEVLAGQAPAERAFRLGGLVQAGSVQRDADSLSVRFLVTDTAQAVPVSYTGILPDLFREGQGIVAQGRLNAEGVFMADQVLAKHDENYMPPEAAEAIRRAGQSMPAGAAR